MAAVRPLIMSGGAIQQAAASDTIDIGAAASSVALVVATKTANYTITTEDVIFADTSGGGFTITLPTAVGATKVRQVKKIAAANTLTIGSTSGTIDGSASIAITAAYTSLTFVSDGTNWFIF